MKPWNECKNILIIRADNMGDLIMSTPALRALKQTFNCRLTVLTSNMGKIITGNIETIDEVIVCDAPWVKTLSTEDAAASATALVETLKQRQFDAAIIFTVYSQNPLPAAMLALMAGIPQRLAYCRENPYALLTAWLPDGEPYTFIQHQVERDLKLVEYIGATTNDYHLSLNYSKTSWQTAIQKLEDKGINTTTPFVIFHAGVSEEKRQYPVHLWKEVIQLFTENNNYTVLLTGSNSEQELINNIQQGTKAISMAARPNMDEFLALTDHAKGVLSVNTGTIHIAAALQTPVLVLYAQTNPQHTPWQVKNIVLPFSVPKDLRSKNEVICFVNDKMYADYIPFPSPPEVADAFIRLIQQ